MDSLNRYGASDDDQSSDGDDVRQKGPLSKRLRVDAAPEVATEEITAHRHLTSTNQKEIKHNLPYEDLFRPDVGPENPFKTVAEQMKGNTVNGSYEPTTVADHVFLAQQRTFMSFGYAVDPSALVEGGAQDRYVGDVVKANALDGADVYDSLSKEAQRKAREWDVAVKD
ncbi:pre-mRNA-processing factor 17, partial [Gonapodya sp. JEL0774]